MRNSVVEHPVNSGFDLMASVYSSLYDARGSIRSNEYFLKLREQADGLPVSHRLRRRLEERFGFIADAENSSGRCGPMCADAALRFGRAQLRTARVCALSADRLAGRRARGHTRLIPRRCSPRGP